MPSGEPVYVANEPHPLNASWLLLNLGDRARLLHNLTFLCDDRLPGDLYLVARATDEPVIGVFGTAQPVVRSEYTRAERSPLDRYSLYRLRLHPGLPRVPAPRVNGVQAAGLANDGELLDLDYREDKDAEVDLNLVMTGSGAFVEVQGTGEEATFSRSQLDRMLKLGKLGIDAIGKLQRKALGDDWPLD